MHACSCQSNQLVRGVPWVMTSTWRHTYTHTSGTLSADGGDSQLHHTRLINRQCAPSPLNICFVALDVCFVNDRRYLSSVTTVCTEVQNCCKGDSPCQWNTPIFRPPGIENPWTDRDQTWSGWLRWGPHPHPTCKLWCFYPLGGEGVYTWNCHHPCLFFTPSPVTFLLSCAPAQVASLIFVVYGSKDVIPRNLCPFRRANEKKWNFPQFFAKIREIPYSRNVKIQSAITPVL